jgi:mannose-1-phosphate guanylyltransferase
VGAGRRVLIKPYGHLRHGAETLAASRGSDLAVGHDGSMAGGALYSVIPAGGSGTRLWPLSRASAPKLLHALTGSSASMLQATVARLRPLSEPDRTYVVTGAAHAAAVARQLPDLPEANLLVEPSPRDSCAAIGLAAALIARRDPDAVMGSFAGDHLIRDEPAFAAAIGDAVAAARQGRLMTVGVKPTYPETGYGYLQCGRTTGPGEIREVARFKEKPTPEVARRYVASGDYLWNAGMFVWRVETFLAELARQQPTMHATLLRITEAWGTEEQDTVLGELWPRLPRISVDHAVMEGAGDAGLVSTVPGDFGWTDVGDFDTLGRVLAATDATGAAGNVVVLEPKDAPVLLRDSERCVVVGQSGRLIVALGVSDLVIVDTPDALLVSDRQKAQDIKSVVDELKRRGDDRFL